MSKGGARPGAGKPKGYKAPHTLKAQTERAKAIAMVEAHLEEIFAPQIAKAIAGDTQAFNAVLDRSWGKPAQALEHKGDVGAMVFLPVEMIAKYNLDDSETDTSSK
jgi:hypothetical protein